MEESLGRAADEGLLGSITDVLTHGVVVSAVVGRDCTSDVVVDVDTVDKNVLSNLEGDGPGRGVVIDGLKLLSKLLSFGACTFAILDILAKSRSDGSDLLNSRDVGV